MSGQTPLLTPWHGQTQVDPSISQESINSPSFISSTGRSITIPRKPVGNNSYTSIAPISKNSSTFGKTFSTDILTTSTFLQRAFGFRLSWFWEIIGVIIGTTSFFAVIVLLRYEDGAQLSQWKFPFSINTVISILGAISRATLAFAVGSAIAQQKWHWFRRKTHRLDTFNLFEEASKGPWGGVRLMMRIRLRNWAIIGALLTVILIGFEPFLQAIVEFETRPHTTANALAMIGQRQRLDAGKLVACRDCGVSYGPTDSAGVIGPPLTIFSTRVDSGMMSSLFRGIDPEAPSDAAYLKPHFICSTGDCTWPWYTSLSVSGHCNDISHHVAKVEFETDDLSEVWNGRTSRPVITIQPRLQYRIPGLNLTNYISQTPLNTVGSEDDPALPENASEYTIDHEMTIMTMKGFSQPSSTLTFQDTDTLLVAFRILRANDDWFQPGKAWEDAGPPLAVECGIYWSAKVYESAVRNGSFYEKTVAVSTLKEPTSWQAVASPEHGLKYDESMNNTIAITVPDYRRSDLQIKFDDEMVERFGLGTPETPTHFNLSQSTIRTTFQWIGEHFGLQTGRVGDSDLLVFPGADSSMSAIFLHSIIAADTIPSLFDKMATSMTTWVRDTGFDSTPVTGTSTEQVVFVKVRWEFIALPGIVTVLSTLYLVSVILERWILRLPTWKGSQTATLMVGLDKKTGEKLRRQGGDEHMRVRMAADVKVMLVGGGKYELKAD